MIPNLPLMMPFTSLSFPTQRIMTFEEFAISERELQILPLYFGLAKSSMLSISFLLTLLLVLVIGLIDKLFFIKKPKEIVKKVT